MTVNFKTMEIALVCASNQNRSMESHYLFLRKGYQNVSSFGTNSQVKLPGPTADIVNVYDFQKTYIEIYNDLVAKDEEFYRKKGLLSILHKNSRVKARPQRFQDEVVLQHDIIFTFEDKVYELVIEELLNREPTTHHPVHIINFRVIDSPEEAVIGARRVFELFKIIESKGDKWFDEVDAAIDEFQEKNSSIDEFQGKTPVHFPILHTVLFY